MSKLHGWVSVKPILDKLLRGIRTSSQGTHSLPWYHFGDLIRYRSSVPYARPAVADALLIWSQGGFGDMTPDEFRGDVLLPANDGACHNEWLAMKAARQERKRLRRERTDKLPWMRISHLLWPIEGAPFGGFHAHELFELVRLINGAPYALKPVADALLLWNKAGFGGFAEIGGATAFRDEVLRPMHHVELAEYEKRRRANSPGAREQTSGTTQPARALVTSADETGETSAPCDANANP